MVTIAARAPPKKIVGSKIGTPHVPKNKKQYDII